MAKKTEKQTEKKTEKKTRKAAAEPELEAVSTRALAFERRVEQLERRMNNAEDVFKGFVKRIGRLDDDLHLLERALAELSSKVATLAGGGSVAPAPDSPSKRAPDAPRASYREIANSNRAARNAPRPIHKAETSESDR